MDLLEAKLAKEKLEEGYTIIVESVFYKNYDNKNNFYLQKGAIGKVIKLDEIIGDKLDYEVYVEWFKDKILTYGFDGDYSYDISFINLKEIIPLKDPNQLEFIFK